jgi:hypothetical protein
LLRPLRVNSSSLREASAPFGRLLGPTLRHCLVRVRQAPKPNRLALESLPERRLPTLRDLPSLPLPLRAGGVPVGAFRPEGPVGARTP